jgi:hypothetical protein
VEARLRASDVQRLCDERGWSRARLMLELRKAALALNDDLPSDDSLGRMIRQWLNSDRGLSERSAKFFTMVFGVPFEVGSGPEAEAGASASLEVRIAKAKWTLDADLYELFTQQTQSFRLLDRRLGARRLLAQTESHVHQMTDVLSYARDGHQRAQLAGAVAEAASLAGWQALDLGLPDKAWILYETGKAAARESGKPAALAHVTAEQAYALLDLGHVDDGVEQIRYARQVAGKRVPPVLRAWLWAAEAEALAAAGEEPRARSALDRADREIMNAGKDTLPYLALDENHLARWRGHCLARLGAAEAVEDLSGALAKLDPSFNRARAGMLCDLAIAYSARGDLDASRDHARQASALAEATTSKRQQRRIAQLLGKGSTAGGE